MYVFVCGLVARCCSRVKIMLVELSWCFTAMWWCTGSPQPRIWVSTQPAKAHKVQCWVCRAGTRIVVSPTRTAFSPHRPTISVPSLQVISTLVTTSHIHSWIFDQNLLKFSYFRNKTILKSSNFNRESVRDW